MKDLSIKMMIHYISSLITKIDIKTQDQYRDKDMVAKDMVAKDIVAKDWRIVSENSEKAQIKYKT
jgi:hypothetical protein